MATIDFSKMITEVLTIQRFHVCELFNPFTETTGFLREDMKEIEEAARKDSQSNKMKDVIANIK